MFNTWGGGEGLNREGGLNKVERLSQEGLFMEGS